MSTPRKSKTPAIMHQPAAQLYERFIAGIKQHIRTAQIKVALAANAELVLHYWEIGRNILASQKHEGWGTKVIDRLAADLHQEFPTLSGYSARNLKYMRAFVEAWPDRSIVQRLVAQLPWGHHCVLLDRVKDAKTREFYIRKTVEHGWSRSVLVHQLDTQLHKRAGKALTNFALTLPPEQSDLAREMIKDPFIFKPAPLDESAHERALEKALLARLKDFLIELGTGFAYVGNQYRLEVDGEEFFLDLLFYHTKLHCYVVIDLLCGRPHNRSSVADFIMWPCQRKSRAFGETKVWRRHIRRDYRLRRNSIKSLSSRHFIRGPVRLTSQRANALAFISKSTSA